MPAFYYAINIANLLIYFIFIVNKRRVRQIIVVKLM